MNSKKKTWMYSLKTLELIIRSFSYWLRVVLWRLWVGSRKGTKFLVPMTSTILRSQWVTLIQMTRVILSLLVVMIQMLLKVKVTANRKAFEERVRWKESKVLTRRRLKRLLRTLLIALKLTNRYLLPLLNLVQLLTLDGAIGLNKHCQSRMNQ